MEKIRITQMEKANLLRAEMDLDHLIIDWDNVEVIDEVELPQHLQETLKKLEKK
jgi:hypothetical protein